MSTCKESTFGIIGLLFVKYLKADQFACDNSLIDDLEEAVINLGIIGESIHFRQPVHVR